MKILKEYQNVIFGNLSFYILQLAQAPIQPDELGENKEIPSCHVRRWNIHVAFAYPPAHPEIISFGFAVTKVEP
jgi:hypothetical protein